MDSIFDLLLDLVELSARLRTYEKHGLRSLPERETTWRGSPRRFVALDDAVWEGMIHLGRLCSANGVDVRQSHYWALLQYRPAYEEACRCAVPASGGVPPGYAAPDGPASVPIGPEVDARFARAAYIARQMVFFERQCAVPPDGLCPRCGTDVTEHFHVELPLSITRCPHCSGSLLKRKSKSIDMSAGGFTAQHFYNALRAGDNVRLHSHRYLAYGDRLGYIYTDTWYWCRYVDVLWIDYRDDDSYSDCGSFDLTFAECFKTFATATAASYQCYDRTQETASTRFAALYSESVTHEAQRRRRLELACRDYAVWLSTFDDKGRYLDTATRYWESLQGETYVHETDEWVQAFGGSQDPAAVLAWVKSHYARWMVVGNEAVQTADNAAAMRAYEKAQHWHNKHQVLANDQAAVPDASDRSIQRAQT